MTRRDDDARRRRKDRKQRRYADELPIFSAPPPETPPPGRRPPPPAHSGEDPWAAHARPAGPGWAPADDGARYGVRGADHRPGEPSGQDAWPAGAHADEGSWVGDAPPDHRWDGGYANGREHGWDGGYAAEPEQGWDPEPYHGGGEHLQRTAVVEQVYTDDGWDAGDAGAAAGDATGRIGLFDAVADDAPHGEVDEVVYVEHREPRRAGRWLAVVAAVVVAVLGVAGVGAFWVNRQIDPGGPTGQEQVLTIPSGTSTAGIADLLSREGVIGDANIFQFYLRINGGGPFQAGDYTLAEGMAMGDVVDVLEAGPTQEAAGTVTVPEGLVLPEIAEAVGRNDQFDAERFRQVVESGAVRSRYQPDDKPLEGLLLPETYALDGREDETSVLQRMVQEFDSTLSRLGYDEAEERVGLTPYETVIVASLIEAEAKVDSERARISRVIHNRLEQGMTLGIDATFYYHLERRGGSLTRSELDADHPYNTRLRGGLVPTPIGAPGAASLAAAIDPEPGPWLYYVLQDATTHAFSEDYDEFLRNRRRAQQEGLIP
jgi:UPF0755 protein